MKTSNFVYKCKEKDMNVFVTYSYQRNIYYRIKEDGFHVSAPYHTSESKIRKGLDKFAEKLLKRYSAANDNYSFENDTLFLLGEQVSLSELNIKNNEDLEAFLAKSAQNTLEFLVRQNEIKIGCPVHHKIVVRNTKNQFGSNSKKTGKLSFQIALVHYSMEIIESVVIHELAHDFERNHGKNFYNIVYAYCPRYKEIQRKLKKGIHK